MLGQNVPQRPPSAARTSRLRFQIGVKANWNPSFESILDLAEANGLSPDYSCRSGICHTCICKLEEGEVDYVLEPLGAPEEGTVLICCSKPKSMWWLMCDHGKGRENVQMADKSSRFYIKRHTKRRRQFSTVKDVASGRRASERS